MPVFWDNDNLSENLQLFDSDYDPRIVRCKKSLESFKTTYGQQPLLPGGRYFFQIRLIFGSNFKIGICKNKKLQEIAFCDGIDGYAYYSAGQLRNGSKTSGK